VLTITRDNPAFRPVTIRIESQDDLDATPFYAFYCEPCAEIVAPEQVDGILTFAQHNLIP